MLKVLLLPALLMNFLAYDTPTEQDYKDIAKDTCDCVNLVMSELSPAMIELIIDSDGDGTKLEVGMGNLMAEDPETTMNDVYVLQGTAMADMEVCMAEVEAKYEEVYTALSDSELIEKIIVELKLMEGCESSVAILKLGMSEDDN